ncbi:hypothetical protein DFJ74DRAFT_289588 [Hyaloraphidium curvatum]|nr:hypothetical protein DFJ74DRAFT_289588 [Hyaloraphidium curvatum]
MREAPGKYLYFAQKSAGQLGCIAHLGTGCANFGGRRQGGAAGPRPGTLAGLGTFSLPKQKSLSKLSPRTPRGDRAEMALARLALASLALAALAGNAAAATNFTQLDPLPALSGCTPSAAGTAPPALDAARTNMTRDAVAVAAWSLPVDGRKIELRLGKETSGRAECVAAAAGNEASCRHELALAGTWRSLRACGWTGPDTASKPGFEVRNNTICGLPAVVHIRFPWGSTVGRPRVGGPVPHGQALLAPRLPRVHPAAPGRSAAGQHQAPRGIGHQELQPHGGQLRSGRLAAVPGARLPDVLKMAKQPHLEHEQPRGRAGLPWAGHTGELSETYVRQDGR